MSRPYRGDGGRPSVSSRIRRATRKGRPDRGRAGSWVTGPRIRDTGWHRGPARLGARAAQRRRAMSVPDTPGDEGPAADLDAVIAERDRALADLAATRRMAGRQRARF